MTYLLKRFHQPSKNYCGEESEEIQCSYFSFDNCLSQSSSTRRGNLSLNVMYYDKEDIEKGFPYSPLVGRKTNLPMQSINSLECNTSV